MKFSDINTPDTRWLLLEASAPRCLAGVLRGDGTWLSVHRGEDGALEGLRAGVENALALARTPWRDIGGFLYGEGPGSALGLRLAAMMLRTWKTLPELADKPVFGWRSLPFLLKALAPAQAQAAAVAVARQGRWTVYRAAQGWEEWPTERLGELAAHRCLFWPQRKLWETPPAFFETVGENPVAAHPAALLDDALLAFTENPDGFAVRPADYRAWTPAR